MTNHEFILDLLKDGYKHCSNELPFRDERARVGELRRGKNRWHTKFDIGGEPCEGRCGRAHDNPDIHWLWLNNPDQYADILKNVTARVAKPSPSQAKTPQPNISAVQIERPVYVPKLKPKPYEYRPPLTCCQVAIYCQEKRLPINHRMGCENAIS